MKNRLWFWAVLLLLGYPAAGADTHEVRVGVFPFANLSERKELEVWRKAFPGRIQRDLSEGVPGHLEVYGEKVLKQLTNHGWNGQQAISPELAAKVSRELNLQKTVTGSFTREEQEWQVEVVIRNTNSDTNQQTLVFRGSSTHRLLEEMSQKTCTAFGTRPDPALWEVWHSHPASNDVVEAVLVLRQEAEAGAPTEEVISAVRKVVASDPGFVPARLVLMQALLDAEKKDDAMAEARKIVELAPGLCWGYLGIAQSLSGPQADQQREEAYLKALEVHPGCPSAAGTLFPVWASRGRWDQLKPAAEKAHAARPKEAVSTAALAAALSAQGDTDPAWDLLRSLESIDEDDDPELHALVMLAASAGVSMRILAQELLWLQRHAAKNDDARDLLSQIDASFRLATPPGDQPAKAPPKMYSPEELQKELAARLSPAELALVENPLMVTDSIAAEARTLTAGLTNQTSRAMVLFAAVIEGRLKTQQQAANSAKGMVLPVCHDYASRLVALARSAGLPAWLVHVDHVGDDYSGFHDRALIRLSSNQVLHFDPSLGTLTGKQNQFRVLDDVQAIAHHLLQGSDLARIRVAEKLDPEDVWTRITMVTRLANLGLLDQAEERWKALGAECTNHWSYAISRAAIEVKREQTADALEWLKRAETLAPNNPEVHLGLSRVYDSLHQGAKSTEHLEKALKLGALKSQPSRRAEAESAMLLQRGMAKAGAMPEAELVALANAGDRPALMTLAQNLFAKGRNDEAMDWLLKAARKGDAIAQENYGRNLYLLKGPSAAAQSAEWLRKAAQQGHTAAYYLLARLLYQGQGANKDAAEASMWAYLGSAAGDKDCRNLVKEMELFVDAAAFAEGRKRAEAMQREDGK